MHPSAAPGSAPHDFAAVYRAHYSFVWRTLRHLGVDPARIDDALQDTFLVVHRRLDAFAGRAALRTWLFEIARRVAARYRRTAAREAPRRCPLAEVEDGARVDDSVARAEAAEILRRFLEQLDRDKSVVFILAELEGWHAPEIAEELDLNLNTVYARLRAARKELDRLVHRLSARDRRPRFQRGSHVLAAVVVELPPPPPPWPDGPVSYNVFKDMSLESLSLGAAGSPAFAGGTGAGLALVGLAVAAVVAFAPEPAAAPSPARTAAATEAAPADPGPAPRIQGGAVPEVLPADAASSIAAPARRPALTPVSLAREPADATALAAELAVVESIRAALLADDADRALTLITRHRRRFRDGAFAQEVAAAGVEARCRVGDAERARREADDFAARWPDSTLVAWVRAQCRP